MKWVVRSIFDDQKNSILRNKLKSIVIRTWNFYVENWNRCYKSFEIKYFLLSASKKFLYIITIDKFIEFIAIWNDDTKNFFDENQKKIQEKAIDNRHSTTIEKIIDEKTRSFSNNRIRFRKKSSRHRRVFYFCCIINRKEMSTMNNNNQCVDRILQ